MDPLTSLRISWRNITDHKLRSTLTTLGVIIGVGAVITFVILGASLQADIVQTIAGENTNIAYVTATSGEQSGIPALGGGGQAVFTEHDVRLVQGIEGVKWAIPESGIAAANVQHGDDVVGRQFVTVTNAQYFSAKGIEFEEGRPFQVGQREVVLNRRAADMFSENVTIGDNITIVRAAGGEELNATVVGIVKAQENGGGQDRLVSDEGPAIYAPSAPFYERTAISPTDDEPQRVYPRIILVVDDVEKMQAISGRVQTALAEEGDARVLAPEGYEIEVTTYDQLVDQIEQISDTFTAYITGVALISLIVGAIGIANMMLVSVTERRREIGIMKAIGAESSDVLQLFLNEAVILGLIGAILGAIFGVSAGWAATEFLNLPFRAQWGWFVAAVVVGIVIGVASGVYPAWSASRIDPIDALRYE